MAGTVATPVGLPEKVASGLQRFCADSAASLGESLVAIVLYGGLAKGETFDPVSSNVNVLVVLDTTSVPVLERLAPHVQRAVKAISLAPMVLSREDLGRSTDVFPVKFLDMKEHHETLVGEDVLAELEISDEHTRLRCEQEIKNLSLRLRNLYLRRSADHRRLGATMTAALSTLLAPLQALIRLKAGEAPVAKADIVKQASSVLDLDGAVLADILAMKEGRSRPDKEHLKVLYGKFMNTVDRAAALVDRHE